MSESGIFFDADGSKAFDRAMAQGIQRDSGPQRLWISAAGAGDDCSLAAGFRRAPTSYNFYASKLKSGTTFRSWSCDSTMPKN